MSQVRCPSCPKTVRIGAPGQYRCPHCGSLFAVPQTTATQKRSTVATTQSPLDPPRRPLPAPAPLDRHSELHSRSSSHSKFGRKIILLLVAAVLIFILGIGLLGYLFLAANQSTSDVANGGPPIQTIPKRPKIVDPEILAELKELDSAWAEEDQRIEEGFFLGTPESKRKKKIYQGVVKQRRELQTIAVEEGRTAEDVVDSEDEFVAVIEANHAAKEAAADAAAQKEKLTTGVSLETEKAIYEACFELMLAAENNQSSMHANTGGTQAKRREINKKSFKLMLSLQARFRVSQATIRKILDKGSKAGWAQKLKNGQKL